MQWGRIGSLVAGAGLVVACGGGSPEGLPRNLLLVVVDTLRADHVSAYGYPRDTTPQLAALAAEGTRVEIAYAPSATTGPTHAALFSGRHPRSVGVRRNAVPLPEEVPTLAERLADAGFATAGVVSSFVLDGRFGFDQGFSDWDDDFEPSQATVRHGSFEGHALEAGFDRRASETTDRALAWLAQSRTAPFFLFVHYFDPHDPYVPPAPFAERFAVAPDASPRDQATARYDAEVAYTDAEIGRLLAGLDALELADDTLVVVTADHGEGLFDHGHLFHDVFLYEEAVRVPLVVRGPGIAAGRVVAGPVSLVDLLPTLLDLVEGPGPAGTGARSFAPLLRGVGNFDAERPIVLERREFRTDRVGRIPVRGEALAVRAGRWKYVEAPEEGRRELYDLVRDPGEMENVSGREPARVAALADFLARWREEHPVMAPVAPVSPEDARRLEALGYVE
ncbi:MAG: sulfatase [Myxococcota bacterium]|nr:sulfatase [Myxococcota bacterium]